MNEIVVASESETSYRRTGTQRHRQAIQRMQGATAALLVVFGGFAVLVLRRPETFLRPQFVYEDGREFYLRALLEGPGSIAQPYAGYLHLVPRLVSLLETAVPVALAPLVGNAIALLIVAGVSAFVASDHVAAAIPDRRRRWVLAAFLLVLPSAEMPLGSITFIQFYLAIFLLAAVISVPSLWVFVAVLAASLTGPFALLLLPVFLLRWWARRDGPSRGLLLAAGAGAVVQLAELLANGRPGGHSTTDPLTVVQILGGHLDTAVFGTRIVGLAMEYRVSGGTGLVVTLVVASLLGATLWRAPRERIVVAALAVVGIVASALLVGSDTSTELLYPSAAARYFMLPTFVLGGLAILAAPRKASIALGALMVIGVVGDLRLASYPDLDWTNQSRCIGGADPCTVVVYPGGIWNIEWPGNPPGG